MINLMITLSSRVKKSYHNTAFMLNNFTKFETVNIYGMKFLLLFYYAFNLFTTFQHNSDKQLVINGTLNNITEPISYIYIDILKPDDNGIDSVKVINNKYSYHTALTAATLVTLYAKSPANPDAIQIKDMMPLMLGPATVNISSRDSFCNAKVTGSEAFKEYIELDSLFINPYTHKKMCMRPDPAIYYHYFKTHPSSVIKPYILDNYGGLVSADDIKKVITPLYNKLSVDDKNSFFGERVKKLIDKTK